MSSWSLCYACVNYAWDVMNAAGIGDKRLDTFGFVVPSITRGEIWPAFNERFLNSVNDYHMAKWNNENPKTHYETLKEEFGRPW